MRRFLTIFLLSLMVACQQHSTFDETIFDEVVYAPEYAIGFNILRHSESGATLLTSTDPWQGAESVAYRLLIDPNQYFGTITDPSIQRIGQSAQRIICMSSGHIAMLDAVGEVERTVGVSGLDFISNDYIISNRSEIGDVGYDNNINYEMLIALNPDLVLLYGINAANSIENKLRELGIPFAYIGEYIESSPLGKAEWMVAVAEIVGKRELGIEVFNATASRYHALSAIIDKHINGSSSPRVMLNTPYRDAWFLPAKSSYMVQLITDAGGECFTCEGEGNSSTPIDIEQALLYASQSDVWLNPSGCNTIAELVALNPKFAGAKPVKKGEVWNNNAHQTKMGGSDFWESGVVCPDIILRDLVTILHPEIAVETEEFHTLHYYKRLE